MCTSKGEHNMCIPLPASVVALMHISDKRRKISDLVHGRTCLLVTGMFVFVPRRRVHALMWLCSVARYFQGHLVLGDTKTTSRKR